MDKDKQYRDSNNSSNEKTKGKTNWPNLIIRKFVYMRI